MAAWREGLSVGVRNRADAAKPPARGLRKGGSDVQISCPKCKQLAANSEAAVEELGIQAEVSKVTDIDKITGYGVMMTPALAVDGKVLSSGRVLSRDEIKKLLVK